MRVAVCSDIHIEYQRDLGLDFIELYLRDLDADVLVIAGDTAPATMLLPFYQRVRDVYGGPIVAVRGNHEYFGYTHEKVDECFAEITAKVPYFYELENRAVELFGQRFIGGTGWFPYDAHIVNVAGDLIPDFKCIRKPEDFVYAKNLATHQFLLENVVQGDVVITHHAPVAESVDPEWAGALTNHFYVSQFGDVIEENRPKLWIHGHMHASKLFYHHDTLIMRNPHGIGTQQTNDYNILFAEV